MLSFSLGRFGSLSPGVESPESAAPACWWSETACGTSPARLLAGGVEETFLEDFEGFRSLLLKFTRDLLKTALSLPLGARLKNLIEQTMHRILVI